MITLMTGDACLHLEWLYPKLAETNQGVSTIGLD